jgi:KipI family sensor histidine kinase inhibitor
MREEWRLAFLGDAALSVYVDEPSPLEANACVHRLARRLRSAAVPGVRDIVPGMRELVLHVDPLGCDLSQVDRALRTTGEDLEAERETSVVVEVPVRYGGSAGPDLVDVARTCGMTPEEVCRRHGAIEYVVCFVGFLPGFPYLGLLDPQLRLPRRATPRQRVPAGSVAIAGEYSGIYPWESPGGWHIIGNTDQTMFDVDATPPARLAPGARVRFVTREVSP